MNGMHRSARIATSTIPPHARSLRAVQPPRVPMAHDMPCPPADYRAISTRPGSSTTHRYAEERSISPVWRRRLELRYDDSKRDAAYVSMTMAWRSCGTSVVQSRLVGD